MAVLAHEHEPQPQHHLALPVRRAGPPPDLVTDLDVCHVADANRHATMRGDHDVPDLVRVGGQADAIDQMQLASLGNAAAASIAVVRAQRAEDIVQGHLVLHQSAGVDQHVVLLPLATPRVHFRHPRHGAQPRLHHPVVDCGQLLQRLPFARDDVVEHLAQARGHGPHLGAWDSLGKLHRLQPLHHQLAGEVDVRPVLEGHCDLGQAELGDRPHIGQARDATDRLFHREGDLLLDLERGEGRNHGVDLDLDRSGVRERVHRQAVQGVDPAASENDRKEHHQKSMVQGPIDKTIQHRCILRSTCCRVRLRNSRRRCCP